MRFFQQLLPLVLVTVTTTFLLSKFIRTSTLILVRPNADQTVPVVPSHRSQSKPKLVPTGHNTVATNNSLLPRSSQPAIIVIQHPSLPPETETVTQPFSVTPPQRHEINATATETIPQSFSVMTPQGHEISETVTQPFSVRAPDKFYELLLNEQGLVRLIDVFERTWDDNDTCTTMERWRNSSQNPSDIPNLCITRERLLTEPRDMQTFQQWLTPHHIPNRLNYLQRKKKYKTTGYPFVDVLGFKGAADRQCDFGVKVFTNFFNSKCNWSPSSIQNRSLLYVAFDDLPKFKKKFERMTVHIFLVSNFHDHPVYPDWLLSSPYVLKWFSVNVLNNETHPKLVGIPLGVLVNSSDVHNQVLESSPPQPTQLLFAKMDFLASPMRFERRWPVLYALRQQGVLETEVSSVHKRLNVFDYFHHLQTHKFMLALGGEGIDSYRLWETLYFGRIPVVGHSVSPKDGDAKLNTQLLADFPVLDVKNWTEVTSQTLTDWWEQHYNDPAPKYNRAKLWLRWWWRLMLLTCLETA